MDIEFEFYAIDKNLEPVFDYDRITLEQGFLYTNYFGLKDDFIQHHASVIRNLIIDNAQSFFSEPLINIDTFYSARKFFGVSDGSYLYCNQLLEEELEQDESYERMTHLLIRSDKSAEAGYADFCANDSSLNNQSIKKMSNLTQKILDGIDYIKAKEKRIENFNLLHEELKDYNLLKIDVAQKQIPMVYPFWTKNRTIKNRLLEHKIYCANYWPNVLDWCNDQTLEVQLTHELIHLPIDQRYGQKDMELLVDVILR